MIKTVVMNMEYGIHEQVTQNRDGSYTVFLNARDCHEMRMASYHHAIGHIMRDDFSKHDVQEIERDAHRREECG